MLNLTDGGSSEHLDEFVGNEIEKSGALIHTLFLKNKVNFSGIIAKVKEFNYDLSPSN
jgi:hypothetical protein